MKRFICGVLALIAASYPAQAGYETGAANQVLRVPSGGGRPTYGAVDLAQSAATTNQLPSSRGGTGLNSSASTGYPSISSGTWSIISASSLFTPLFESVATTGGDLIYGGASGVPTRLANGSSGNILQSQGSTSAPIWASIQGNTTILKAPTVQVFASGSGTYTTPTSPSPLYLIVEEVGGGGGGGGSGTTSGTAGSNGGDTTFSVHSGSAFLTAGGGTVAARGLGGSGGTATVSAGGTKIIAVAGGLGNSGQTQGTVVTSASPQSLVGGSGGSSYFGGNGSAGSVGATNTGGGGGGGLQNLTSSGVSGAGGGAGAYIKALITSPSASYDYSVGTAGNGQGAGTSGTAGGNGGSGYIVVTEYYQ